MNQWHSDTNITLSVYNVFIITGIIHPIYAQMPLMCIEGIFWPIDPPVNLPKQLLLQYLSVTLST